MNIVRSTIGNGTMLLEIFALARPQIVENQQQLGARALREFGDLGRLAAADQRGRIDGVAALHDAIDDARTRGARERLELIEFRLERPRVRRLDGGDDGGHRPIAPVCVTTRLQWARAVLRASECRHYTAGRDVR